jgi:uncharacterized protein (TIGR03084 family)
MAVGSAAGRFAEVVERLTEGAGPAGSIDDGAELMVRRDRGPAGPEILERWRASVDALRIELDRADPHRRVTWVAGELSVRTLATTRLAETWIHTGDVAAALGVSLPPDDRIWHIARLAWRTLPYAFASAGRQLSGPVAFVLDAPTGATWNLAPDEPATTTITGPADELCLVAARRTDPVATTLAGDGPDAGAVLALVRTYA